MSGLEVFGVVAAAIELARQLWNVIDSTKSARKRLSGLAGELQSLEGILDNFQESEPFCRDDKTVSPIIWHTYETLKEIQGRVEPFEKKLHESFFTRSRKAFFASIKEEDITYSMGLLLQVKVDLLIALQ